MYQEIAPSGKLAHVVEAFWEVRGSRSDRSILVTPDGCIDIILSVGKSSRLAIVGGMSHFRMVPLSPESLSRGIRFRPGCASTLFSQPMNELLDVTTDLAGIVRNAGELQRELEDAKDLLTFAKTITDKFLSPRIEKMERKKLDLVKHLQRIREGSLEELSQDLQLSERHFRRLFTQAFGMNPRLYLRARRLHALRQLALRDSNLSLAQLAVAAGYYDQPHMSREIKDLTTLTPLSFLDTIGCPKRTRQPQLDMES